jgi:hypothetical protein
MEVRLNTLPLVNIWYSDIKHSVHSYNKDCVTLYKYSFHILFHIFQFMTASMV